MKSRFRYRLLDVWVPWDLCILLLLLFGGAAHAQHLRFFACAIANDSAGAFMGGSSNGSGLYQSDDTGKTWKHLGWDNIKCYSMDMVRSSNGHILYEATGLGVLRSTDDGITWKQLTDWRVSEVMDIAVDQKNPEEIYIATAHGPWKTEDGGKSWISTSDGMRSPYSSHLKFDPSTYTKLFLAAEDGLYRRSTTESSWRRLLATPAGAGSYYSNFSHGGFEYRNVTSLLRLNDDLFIGTLGDGIWNGQTHALPHLQIWTLKSFPVNP